jgi:hypothetical protein
MENEHEVENARIHSSLDYHANLMAGAQKSKKRMVPYQSMSSAPATAVMI